MNLIKNILDIKLDSTEVIEDIYDNNNIKNILDIKLDSTEVIEDIYDNNNIKNINIDKKKLYKNIICCNCGKYGHFYKKCFNPITSFGIICFKTDNLKSISSFVPEYDYNIDIFDKKMENNLIFNFLLIRRKDSLAFAEFVRVKYNIYNFTYIKKLLENMTHDELYFLQNVKNPDDIWNRLWTSKKKSYSRLNEYIRVKKKLLILINGIRNEEGIKVNLKYLICDINILKNKFEAEWGFPKGRRIPKESEIECAIREFCEETDIDKENINILKNIKPFEEIFIGSNNILYKHVYYIAEIKNDVPILVNPNNIHQMSEIGDIRWFNKEEAINKIENKNKERINIFTKVYTFLKSLNIPHI